MAYEGDSSASFLACESDFGVSLESIFAYDVDIVATLGSLGGHFWHLKAASGALWGYLGSTCGIWGNFGATLGSF